MIRALIPKVIINKITKPTIDFYSKYLEFANLSYSQEGEDMVVKEIFFRVNNGIYVDIGAYHPKKYSNTYFYYKRGWRGINIDPTPGVKEFFDKERPEDINLNFAVSKKEETLNFYMFNEPGLNTFNKERAEYISNERSNDYKIINQINVKSKPLSYILDNYLPSPNIHFMSIDVEMHEMEVLESNNWIKYKPWVIAVEILDFSLETIEKNKIHLFLRGLGYSFYAKTKRTCFYALEKVIQS